MAEFSSAICFGPDQIMRFRTGMATWFCTRGRKVGAEVIGQAQSLHGSTNGCLRWPRKTRIALSRGFTLIELLVALVLLALMFLLLTSALRFGTTIWSEKDNALSDASHVLVVENLIRRLLSEARPVILQPTKDRPAQVNFSGTKDSIRFVAPMLQHLSTGGFYEITIKLNRGAQLRNSVEMFWRMFPQPTEERRAVLLNGDINIEFSFFGSRREGEAAQWYVDWRDQLRLPELILTRLTVGDHRWPDLMVSTKVQSINLIAPEPDYF